MAERLHGRQNDNSLAGPPHSPLRYHRNRKRQLALQEPWRGSPDNPRPRRLRNPDQLRRRERYRPDPSLKGVPFGCKSGVPIGCRLTASKAVRRGSSASTGEETEIAGLRRQLSEALEQQTVLRNELRQSLEQLSESLEQQTATAGVLKVISRSPFDLQAVLDTLVRWATRLCDADSVTIGRPKGESLYFEATYGFSQEFAEFFANHPTEIDRGTVSGRVLLERKILHVLDVLADPEYTYKFHGYRTLLGVPLLREGSPIGT